MIVESAKINNKPTLKACVVKSGIYTAVASGLFLPETLKASMKNAIMGKDKFVNAAKMSAEKTAEYLNSKPKALNINFSNVADKLPKIDTEQIVKKAEEIYPAIKKQGMKMLGVLAAITAVNSLVLFVRHKNQSEKQ